MLEHRHKKITNQIERSFAVFRHKLNQKNTIARSNPNVFAGNSQSKQLFLLKTDATYKHEPEIEPNPLAIINALLDFKNPEDLLKWLDSEDHNPAKLIKFIVAVCNNYNKLAADCTIIKADWINI